MQPLRPIRHLASVTLLALAAALPGAALAQGRARPAPAAAGAVPVPASLLRTLAPRSIGPAIMGGRVADIALDPSDQATWYVALGTGGVMKTADNGTTFSAVFEREAVAAVGAVAVSPANPRHVWVGTGEANDRNSSAWGDGVYRSTDGGATWVNTGLRTSRTIARIVPHPTDTNTVYVAAMGDLWNAGGERGLFKTTDGGKSWQKVLGADRPLDGKVGAGDVVLDPRNPETVYAALYGRRRTPWSFVSGAEWTDGRDVGGIFRSTDGGRTWTKLVNGLPTLTQRIGLAISPADPRVLYAVVQSTEGGTSNIDDMESKRGGVFVTSDGGATWRRMNALNPRPFYFSQIRTDPDSANVVWLLGYALHVSRDSGRTFSDARFKGVHGDNHALAIDPRRPSRMLVGSDGGIYQTWNGGRTWEHHTNFAAGEFYRINVDQSTPFRICGGLQDNLNWVGPSRTNSKEGIRNADWVNIGGGDGFYCVFDPDDPDVVYAESQQGYLHRMNMRTGEMKGLRPEPPEGQEAFRFHWNSPLIGSVHRRGTMYLAGNRVFRLTDRGERWAPISPDLSARDVNRIMTTGSGAETYGVVYTLAESPKAPGLLWAGTDDGKLWVTRDDGATWTDLTASLPAAAKGQWISRVEASHHDPAVAYLAVGAFRSGNYAPLAWRTADGGRTWRDIAANLPADGPVKVIREDPVNPDLLYAGTEFALFVSLDQGRSWTKWPGLPTVAFDDILVHPRDRDLVLATHGRSLYVVDDIGALQQYTPEVAAAPLHLFAARPADGHYQMEGWADYRGAGHFAGANPPVGAFITYHVGPGGDEGRDVAIAISDATGRPVANLTGPGRPGVHRVVWDFFETKDLLPPWGMQRRLPARSGTYTVRLSHGAASARGTVEVRMPEGMETR